MRIWDPPANFIELPSQLEGVSVYGPAPEPCSDSEHPTTYTCPQCGARTQFNVSVGGIACEHCGFCAPAESSTVGTDAEEFEFTPDALAPSSKGLGSNRRTLACEQCGAVLSLPEKALTITCPFCTSHRISIRESTLDELQPRHLIPFKIQPQEIQLRAKEWLGKGWFHPDELSRQSRVDHFTGIYLPFWTFDANIIAHWKAEVGHEKQESYYDASSKTWQTRTKVVWRWENGEIHLPIDDLQVKGSGRISGKILERILPFDLSALREYHPDFLAGWNAQHYDVDLAEAWEEGKVRMREAAKCSCFADIPTRHVRNFSMVADFSNESWRYILLPVYISAYQFGEQVFQIMVNGQNGLVAGQKPVAWWKVWLAIFAMLLPGIGLGLIGLPLLLLNGLGFLPLVLSGVLLTVGGIFALQLYHQAADSEAA